MIKKREIELALFMVMVQVVLTLLVFLTTSVILNENHRFHNTIALMAQITIVWGFFLYYLNLGFIFRTSDLLSMIRGYLVTVFFGCLLMFIEVLIISMFRSIYYSIEYIFIFGIINLISLITFKISLYSLMLFIRRKGYNKRNVLILANSESASFIESFISAKDWGYEVHSIVSADIQLKQHFKDTKIINTNDELFYYIKSNPVDDIFYCLPITDTLFNIENLKNEVNTIGVSLHILQQPDIQKGFFKKPSLSNLNYITHTTVTDNYLSLKIKDSLDIILSVVALLLTSPFMLLLAILIKQSDGGSVFFFQERVGLNGRLFKCIKFRTMVMNAEDLLDQIKEKNEADGPVFKIGNDPRITKIGRFLRKTSLDEFPQFINVIRSEMSIVGPRPPLLKEVQQYEQSQLRRLSMKPGITCKWQVWGRHQVSFKEWMQMDLDYIDNWSLWLDFKIMISTIAVVLKAKGH